MPSRPSSAEARDGNSKEIAMSRYIALAVAIVLAVSWLGAPVAWAQASKSAKSAPAGAKVNLNTATQAELEELPGVGEATAKKIVAGRPYSSVADLSKAGVPAKTIEKITPLVAVGGAAPPSAKAAQREKAAVTTEKPEASAAGTAAKSTKSSTTEARVPPTKGMVWVNTKSGVFHREGDRWYGKTKEGKFMTEADALKAGHRASKEGGTKEGTAKQ
jgi:helix-hairpin-helix protein